MQSARTVVSLITTLAWACTSASPPAGAPGEPLPVPAAAQAPDVRFMQGMIAHHAQAIAMTRLVPERTIAGDVRTLAERILVSQREEIALMQQWLRARGHSVPDTTHLVMGHHAPGDTLMPGMLSEAQLRTLQTARGSDFDRAFLSSMIQHHQGAITMVQRLLASPGGAQDPEAWRFAADVDADQRAEIARMTRMLHARQPG